MNAKTTISVAGWRILRTERTQGPLISFTKVLEIDSQFKEAYYQLGAAYLKNGKFECAVECARKALAIDPNYKDASDLINSIDINALKGECEHGIP